MKKRRKKKGGGGLKLLIIVILLILVIVLIAKGCHKSDNTNGEPSGNNDSASAQGQKGEGKNSKDEQLLKMVDSMDLHQKVSQMFISTPEALTGFGLVVEAGDATKKAIEETPVGGLIYFAANMESEIQTVKMISKVQDFSQEVTGAGMFISVDEEGGKVARVAESLGTTKFQPMFEYKDQGAETARDNASVIARDINVMGYNLDFAPVADTWVNKSSGAIGERAYSDDYAQAAELVAAAVEGFHDGGVMCTLKHFPGHGAASGDSHGGTVYVNKELEQIKKEDLLPFKEGIKAGADMVMVGHITVKSVDQLPASLSHAWVTDILRNEMGYEGVVITDSLIMGAVSQKYSQSQIVVMAVQAGNDMLLVQSDLQNSVAAVEAAVNDGSIDVKQIDESVLRILKLKQKYGLIGE